MPTEQRWAEKYPDHLPADECWPWPDPTLRGYGRLWDGDNGVHVRAHRRSYELAYGAILDDDLCVCHTCDNRACVNPAHLFLGTRADNLADMRQKRRGAKGETHGRRKLTASQVAEIRDRRAAGEPRWSVAKAFGVCGETVSLITSRKTWNQ